MATEYGTRLKQSRNHAGFTQMALSKKTGIPQSTISTAEREGNGSGETPVYAKACGVNSLWLATGEGDMLDINNSSNSLTAPNSSGREVSNETVSLAQITKGLAGYFEAMDANTRKMAMGLIGQLADDPQDHARIAAMIELSIHSKRPKFG